MSCEEMVISDESSRRINSGNDLIGLKDEMELI